ncbi:MAG: dephospho-CoA kinase [Sulfurospirillaceae bacterium]|nr:dephospho-CoA kinase [Sulfurospirillaceae bacterium]MDD3462070.1 dephospho-CoA kinase [Sulfurospirillaceae bacterium]
MTCKYGVALTGGIASGKSTVCNLLKLHGFYIIDADVIAKEVFNEHQAEILELFDDDDILAKNGKIDRKILGQIIFSNENKRKKLNSFMHPLIQKEIERQSLQRDEFKVPYIIDIPLYFESGGYKCKNVALVYVPQEIQLKRLIGREGLSADEARMRIDAQIDIEAKREKADWIIDNSFDLKHLQDEVEKFVDFIRGSDARHKI